MVARAVVAAGLMAAPAAARAEWREAQTGHFVVYADMPDRDIAAMAERLERFDRTLRLMTSVPSEGKVSNRVTIFVVESAGDVQRLCGKRCSNVAGLYLPSINGPIALTPRRASGELDPEHILRHEYAHHFLLGSYAAPVPGWFSEGYAEFLGATVFEPNEVEVGRTLKSRAYSLFQPGAPTPRQLLIRPAGAPRDPRFVQADYAQGWLLTHYLQFDAKRRGQLGNYLTLLGQGKTSAVAAEQAFGNLAQLDRDVAGYLRRRSLPVLRIALDQVRVSPAAVRPLSRGEAAMIDLRMRSARGVDLAAGKAVYALAAPIAAAHPADPVVQGWFAEMAYDAREDTVAEAAADRALAADPKSPQALLYKARVLMRRAAAARAPAPAWQDARDYIVRANDLDHDDAEALFLYHQSFAQQGVKPSAAAVAGLHRAVELVPQVPGIRFAAMRQAVMDGDVPLARATLAPLAYDPHAAPDNPAARLMAVLDSGNTAQVMATALEDDEKAQ